MATAKKITLEIAGRAVTISNPDKVYFPSAGHTKLDLVRYYLAVADGALRGAGGRPMAHKRYVHGAAGEFFFQKRAPENRPDWIRTAELRFPSGRTADEIVLDDAAQLAWIVNLGCIDLNPHPVRADDLDHPDELRIDLDPAPGVAWETIREVALVARAVLADHGMVGWPKTSGSRGIHINVRIHRRWSFPEVRHAALAIAREVERRAPAIATAKWWKEERGARVFLDYNQNAKDRTVASAYSVRPTADARVSMPLGWDDVADCDPAAFTLGTVPAIFAARGDAHSAIDEPQHHGSLESLLALDREQRAAQGEAPLPPHYAKAEGEPARVQPSRRRTPRVIPEGVDPNSFPLRPGRASADGRVPAGRRTPKKPLVVIGRAQDKQEALAGLTRWKERWPAIAAKLAPEDILVDAMRGRSTAWWRVRVNLEHIPEGERPPQEALDPDFNPETAR